MAGHHEIDRIPELKPVEKQIRKLWKSEDDIWIELPQSYCSKWCNHKIGYTHGKAYALKQTDQLSLPDDWEGCGIELHANGTRIRQIYLVI